MTTELFDLCKEVYELTGWKDTEAAWRPTPTTSKENYREICIGPNTIYDVPLYNTDYILDQLIEKKTGLTLYHVHSTMTWEAFYAGKFFEYGVQTQHWETQGDSPLKALLRLVIELYKDNRQGKKV